MIVPDPDHLDLLCPRAGEKACRRCQLLKPEAEYYDKDRTCKDCRKTAARETRSANLVRCREYDRERQKAPARRAASYASHKAIRATEDGKLRRRVEQQEHRKRKPHLNAIHLQVEKAVRAGLLEKTPCEWCGDPNVVAHHDDYSKPLDVVWLCPLCHARHHNSRPREKGGTNAGSSAPALRAAVGGNPR